mgnify:CR=1 FL=1|jgi:HK97 gp10 family phage protein|tara:strand:- start:5701 stop:6144 length:444 start_codon:yes stop_codon:yes gene_type:complete
MSQISLKISNLRAFNKKLNRTLNKEVVHGAKGRMQSSVQLVRKTAVESIQRGVKTGETYKKYNPKRTHTASAAGQPPATDTGFLVQNITTDVRSQGTKVIGEIIASTPYAKALEFGTRKMAARPYLNPALRKNKKKIQRKFRNSYFK